MDGLSMKNRTGRSPDLTLGGAKDPFNFFFEILVRYYLVRFMVRSYLIRFVILVRNFDTKVNGSFRVPKFWYETQWFGSCSDSWFVISVPVRNGSVRNFHVILGAYAGNHESPNRSEF